MVLVVPGHWIHAQACKKSSDGLHADILSDNINNALHGASSHDRAAGLQKHCAHLGLASPFSGYSGGKLQDIDAHGYQLVQR